MANSVNRTINIWLNQHGIDNNLKSIRAEIAKTANELNKLPIGSEEWFRKSEKLSKLKSIYSELQKEIGATSRELDALKKRNMDQVLTIGALSAAAQTASAALQRFVSVSQEYVDAYATIDDAMSAVQKTTGMTREEVEQLHKELKSIDTRTSTEELLKIAEIGGRMGIAQDQIRGFTEAVNKANVALGDSFQGGAEEISSILGKISLAYKETKDQDIGQSLTQIGSALNEVGASANATEGNIAAFVQRVGSMPEVFRPTVQQAIALGAAFEESSIDAEVASRAFGIVMMKASTNVEKFAKVMGQPVEAVKELINTNPAQFFMEFSASLKGLEGTEVGAVLKDLKLNADGVNKIIGAMSSNTERFTEILNTSNAAFAEAVSLDNEYAVVNENSAAQLEKAKKAVQDAKAALGKELIPVLTKLTETTADTIHWVTEAVKWVKEHKTLVIALAIAYNRQAIALMALNAKKQLSVKLTAMEKAGESAATVVTNLLTLAKAKLAGNTLAAANAQKALKLAFAATPWGAIITAVTTLAAAFVMFRGKTEEATDAQKDLEVQVEQQYKSEEIKIRKLQSIIESETTSREAKLTAIKKLQSIIPDYLVELDKEGKVVNNNKKAIDDYLVSLRNKIKYQALEKELGDLDVKLVKAEKDRKDAQLEYSRQGVFEGVYEQMNYWWNGRMTKEQKWDNAKVVEKDIRDQMDTIIAALDKMDKELKDKTGKTYAELFNENILEDLDDPNKFYGNVDEKLADKLKTFEEKVAKMRRKDEADTLEGWAKIKKKIENDYADVITEAKELYGENDSGSHVKAIVEQKNQAIAEAGEKYLKDAEDAFKKMKEESDKWLKDAVAAGEDVPPIVKAITGTEKQWDGALATVRKNIAALTSLLGSATNQEDADLYKKALYQQIAAEKQLTTDMAKATLATLQKFIADESKLMDDESVKRGRSGLSERKRLIAETEEEYKIKIEAKKREIDALQALDNQEMTPEEKAAQLAVLNNQLETLMKWQTEDVKKAGQRHNVWEDLINIDWANFSADWEGNLEKMTAALKEFADAAFDIFNSINQIQSNKEQAAFDEWSEIQDEKADRLKQQLEDGLISQAYYDAQMEQLQKEKEEKEKQLQHEQFEREKKAGIAQALIQGALAIVTAFAQMGPIAGAIAAAIVAATTALQVAAIASQVNPYAKGGFIRGEQMALMGEQGDEWVASNQLLEDRRTAPLIAALEAYQRGNRRAIDDLVTVEEPRWEKLSQSSRRLSRTFAGDSVGATNIYNTNTNNSANADTLAVLTELQTMNRYLKDPKNRQAYISRKMQLEYEENENELKEMARL